MNTKYSYGTFHHTGTEDRSTVEVFLNNYTIKRICKNCGNKFEYHASEYCSSECAFEAVEHIIVNGS